MPTVAPQIPGMGSGEDRLFSLSFAGKLEEGEALTGAPTVFEVYGSGLTISDQQVSTTELTINGKTVAIGQAVQWRVQAPSIVPGRRYTIDVLVGTDAPQILDGRVIFEAT